MKEYIQPNRGVGIGSIPILDLVEEIRKRDSSHGYLLGAVLPDWAIRKYISIEPFVDYGDHNQDAVVSYGLTSAGYDIRAGYKFKVFTNLWNGVVSPRGIPKECFVEFDLTPNPMHEWSDVQVEVPDNPNKMWLCAKCGWKGFVRNIPGDHESNCCGDKVKGSIIIPPNCFALAETLETLYIPRKIDCLCLGKSTYARCGIIVNFTPFEPGWWGRVTVEISNSTPNPVEILCGYGIGQAKYYLLVADPEKAYGEKKGAKYQGQGGLTLPNERIH